MDDITLYQVDNFERLKPFKPKAKDVVGISNTVPMNDNDEELKFFDIQGESLFTNPSNSNNPTIDHGLEEDEIWAFRLTGFNQVAFGCKDFGLGGSGAEGLLLRVHGLGATDYTFRYADDANCRFVPV